MAVQGQMVRGVGGRTLRRRGTNNRTTSLFWIYAWALASIVPILPYASSLWIATLDDTPYAYLIWIPVFAFVWAGWTLRRALSYNDDAELNAIMGVPLLALSGTLLVAGLQPDWQYAFVGQSAGLLVWPFWALGMAWLLFGVGVTRYVIRPLAYLWLTWPPLYSDIVNATNPVLENLANHSVTAWTHAVHWLHTGASVGAYNIDYGLHQSVTVYVTTVCSGADSLLAVVILFPVILVSFVGSAWRKFLCFLLAAVMALLANIVRLGIIIASVHLLGPGFSLGVLHPVLGIILFTLMIALVIRFAHALGLANRRFQRSPYLRKPGGMRFGVSLLSFSALTALLWPLYQGAPGTQTAPVPVGTDNVSQLMPPVQGWQRTLIGRYDEAVVLGPGAKSAAYSYKTVFGDYVLSELWWTYQPLALQGYPENNCLLFHGAQIMDTRNVAVSRGITATAFTVLLPPDTLGGPRAMFVDTVYSFLTRYRGRTAYLRSEIAAPVELGVTPGNPVNGQMPTVLSTLFNPQTPIRQAIYPLSQNQTIHLRNYFTFVRQYTDELIALHGHYPAVHTLQPKIKVISIQ